MSQPTAKTSDLKLDQLVSDLSSSDPAVRDGESLDRLCELIDTAGLSKHQVGLLGSRLIEQLAHPRVEARSFAALVLARAVLSGASQPDWFPQFAPWYAGEEDVAGYDAERGWLHAVAHGADALGAFGRTWTNSPRPVLDLAANRLLNPSTTLWHDQEDDRLGFAIAITLSNPHLSQHDAVTWMEPLKQALLDRAPGPLPAYASNTIRTLRVVCLLTNVRMKYEGHDLWIRHASAVERALREVLHTVSPWMWSLEGV